MNILVVHPIYPGKSEIKYLPLGLGYVAAVAEQAGHEITVVDMHNMGVTYAALERTLAQKRFQVCFMGGFAMQVKGMRHVTEIVKRAQADCRVILGGVGVSDIPEVVLRYTGADVVATGESENALPPLLRALEEEQPCEDLAGFVYRRGDSIIRQPRALAPQDLDALPYPAYHLFDVEYISRYSYNGRGARSMHMLTSRGCPFKCNFCINSVINNNKLLKQIHGSVQEAPSKAQRFRSVDSLAAEIEMLRSRYGVTDFHFADEEFITHRKRLEEVCSAVEPLGVTWSTSGRADWATEDKLSRMKKAGCTYVLFGVESGSQTLLDAMDKNAKKPAVAAGLQAARNVGMQFIANFMVGHPAETETSIRETVDFCKEQKLLFLPSYVTLFPNSKMFHDYVQRGMDWNWYFESLSTIDFSKRLFLNLTELPTKQLLKLRNWAVAETFSHAVAPRLSGPLHRGLTMLLIVALFFAERCPQSIHWLIRNVIRRLFDFAGGPQAESTSRQVAPNEFGQESHVDTYEESLKELKAAELDVVVESAPRPVEIATSRAA
ncbi:MAG: B12-binding domain-containing radical SAM protein [Planctomycetaceae bacterium]|nr:B12-binding domain-containing radical SAM protein [Planctomycetaceae bacterium]